MIPHSWRICSLTQLLTLVYITNAVKGDSCTLSTLPKKNGENCTGQLDCLNQVNYDVKTTWSCIQHVDKLPDYYGVIRPFDTYSTVYNLIINILEPDENDLFNFEMEYFEHIIKLTIKNGYIITIPQEVYQMTQLTEISISGTKIVSINLNNFIWMSSLREINLANNSISVLNMDGASSTQLSNVEKVDISCNSIEIIPHNFISRFTLLQHLNLSHNMISSIGLLTFEGVSQLKTLDMSYNRLHEVGNAFARFTKLKELFISNNNLTTLLDYNFDSLKNLEKLNASSNHINNIENNTFQSLVKLTILDLSYNKIETITKQLVTNNVNLHVLLLINNQIQSIEANTFEDMNITTFCIRNNYLRGAVEKDTFNGINVFELDISGGSISSIENRAFTNMIYLNYLNLSSNAISNISHMAFSSLVSLKFLDLSHNKLKELTFESYELKNLTKLFAQNNRIERISKKTFDNFLSLLELDLSNNNLKEIESQSFSKLIKLKNMKVSQSHFVSVLESNVLEGLTSLQKYEASGTRTKSFKNQSFIGFNELSYINSAFGELAEIEYNAFLGTGFIKVLDISNNQLYSFYVNSSTISKIEEINLNNNLITNVSSETFSKLTVLRKLNLAKNYIKQLSSNVFQSLNALMYLDLSSNERMKIFNNSIQYLSKLYRLSLENVKTDITFENSSPSIEVLDMPSCGINYLNKVFLFKVNDLSYLNLSMNEIAYIDKDSFRNLSSLVSLDLSCNMIMNIQPGSFLHFKQLIKLNLSGNNLPSIQFGVFDSTEVLKELDLSSNVLHSFDVKMLQSPVIARLSLDKNVITNLNFIDFFNTHISELSIGGNQISCKVLAEIKTSKFAEKFRNIVTAKTLNYHSENVNGISCQTFTNKTPGNMHLSDNSSVYISPFISSFKNAISEIDKTSHMYRDSNEIKAVLYFIAICLAVLVVVYLGNFVFSHVNTTKRSRSNSTSDNATLISNSIEME